VRVSVSNSEGVGEAREKLNPNAEREVQDLVPATHHHPSSTASSAPEGALQAQLVEARAHRARPRRAKDGSFLYLIMPMRDPSGLELVPGSNRAGGAGRDHYRQPLSPTSASQGRSISQDHDIQTPALCPHFPLPARPSPSIPLGQALKAANVAN